MVVGKFKEQVFNLHAQYSFTNNMVTTILIFHQLYELKIKIKYYN